MIKKVIYPRPDYPSGNWISRVAQEPVYSIAANLVKNQPFVQGKPKQFQLQRHALWLNDNAQIFTNIPVSTFTPARYVPMAAQALSFRVHKRYRYKPVRTGTPRPGFQSAITPAFAQLVNSYLMSVRAKQRSYYHDWADDQAAIMANVPVSQSFNPVFMTAINALVGRWEPKPRWMRRGNENLWNTVPRTSAMLFEAEEILAGIFSQQFGSFRPTLHARLNTLHLTAQPEGWIAFEEIARGVARQSGAMAQLAQVEWLRWRKKYRPEYHDQTDLGAWMYVPASFDAALTAAFIQSLESYRSLSGRKFDLFRNLDTSLDAWMGLTTEQQVPSWSPAFASLFNNAFIVDKRRMTHNPFLHETIHDLAFTRAVLDLTDAPFGIPRAHWRHIEGAIRRRRRHRRR